MIERLLRWTAVAIAILALLDPAMTLAGRARPRIAIVVQDGPSMALPVPSASKVDGTSRAAGPSRLEVAQRVGAALAHDLRDDFDATFGMDQTAAAGVVIGDRYPDEPVPDALKASTVTVAAPFGPNVRVARVDAPRSVPPATAVRIDITLEASGVRGGTTGLTVRSRGADVGRASHTWTADQETWRAQVDAVPVGTPPFSFDVAASPIASETTSADNRASVLVDQSAPLRVLVFEARPSWASAFVRRALESDPRFDVSGISQTAPRAVVRTDGDAGGAGRAGKAGEAGRGGFDRIDDLVNVDVILVGGLEALTPANLSTLDRFMRERGGVVALLPDARPPASIARELAPGVEIRETLLERSAALDTALPRIDASELLEAGNLPTDAGVLARAPSSHQPIVWTLPRGDGRLFVSGAMDAWRYRADTNVAFDRFWRSAIAGLALSARRAIEIHLEPERAAPGERVRVFARVRALERRASANSLAVEAHVAGKPLRLWADAESGTFTGSFTAEAADANSGEVVTVRLRSPNALGASAAQASPVESAASGSARLTIDANPREAAALPLSLLADTHGGVNVHADGVATLEQHLRRTIVAPGARTVRRPMRSSLWFIPFAACLSGEWWLRRRRGAR